MKNFNFFNRMRGEGGKFANTPPYGFNHASRCGNIIATSALTVGSPSAHRRGTMQKHVAFMLLFLLGSLNVWGENAPVNTILWAENFAHYSSNDYPSNKGTGSGTTIYGNASINYSQSSSSNVKAYTGNQTYAGGTGAELYIKSGENWTISGIKTGGATELTLTYKSNNTNNTVTCTTSGTTVSGSSTNYTITTGGAETITLKFSASGGNTRIDDVVLKVKTAGASCDNKVTVTKASATNGSFTLREGTKTGSVINNNGTINNCDADAKIVVIPSPSTNYHVANVTATNYSSLSEADSEGNYTITYTKGSSISTEIGVTFEADPQYTVTWVAGSNTTFHTQTNFAGTDLTAPGIPDAGTYCAGGKVFKGWTATPIVGETNEEPTDLFTSVSGKSIPVNGTTYYAVFATENTGESIDKNYSFTISPSDFNSTSYAANNNEKTTKAINASDANDKIDVKWTSNQVYLNGTNMQWQKSNGYIYNSTDLGTITSVNITSSEGTFTTYYGTSAQPSSNTTVGNGYFQIKVGGATGKTSSIVVSFTKTVSGGTIYSAYATSCCTQHIVTVGSHANGEISIEPTSACEGTTINVTLTPNTGYRLTSWSVNNVEKTGTSFLMPNADAVVSATFEPEVYTISYKDEGDVEYSGSNLASLPTAHTYNVATPLVDGVRDGFSFAGWFIDAACETPAGSSIAANSQTADFTLYAKWTAENKKRVTISEVSNGSVSVTYEGMESPLTSGYRDLSDNTVLTISATPADGYELSSLKIGDDAIENNSQHTLTAAITISATFSPINYSITYYLDGGTNHENNPANYTIASGEITLEAPTKEGYTFDGWFNNENKEGDAVTAIAAGSKGNKEFWGKWHINNYTISWVTDGDELTGDYTTGPVEFGTAIVAPNTPTKTGYTFAGWDASIAETMPASDVTYTATWTVNKYHVYFQNNGEVIDAYTKEVDYNTAIGNLPSYDDSCDPTSTIFRGWSTSVITIKQENAPTFAASTNLMPAEDLYLNAVYASETEGPEANVNVFATTSMGNTNAVTNGYTISKQSEVKAETGHYTDGSSGATKRWIQIKKNNTSSAMITTTPKSVTVTATLGGGQAKVLDNNVYAVWVDANDNELGDAVVLTNEITNANGSEFEANLPIANATSAYGVRVYHTKESGYNVRYYGISLSYKVSSVDYNDFVTSCCSLKPVTDVVVSDKGTNSVTLTWSAPVDKTGIDKLQIINAANNEVVTDDIDKDALTGIVNGLTECDTYNFIVVSVGTNCNAYSEAVEARPFGSEKTVTFVYNDGTTQDVVEHTSCDATSVAVPTDPEREGYRFMGWFNGENQLTEATFTPTETSTTINAHWAELFTLHYNYDGASGAPADEQYIADEEVILPANPVKNVMSPFQGWSYSTSVDVAEGKFLMPASNLTITAVFGGLQGQWFLVTDANSLQAGDKVVIAAADYNYAMSTTQNTNNRGRTAIEKNGTTLNAPSNDVQIFELEEGTVNGSWAFKCLNGDKEGYYIYAAGSGNSNYLKSEETKSGNSSFVLDIEKEKATAQGTSTNNVLRYNSNNSIFSCYSTANQSGIAFYQFREGTFYNVNMPGLVTGGTITTNASMAKAGETVTLTYTPSRGYTIGTLAVTGVEITPALTEGITEYTFTMPDEDVTVTASFNALPPVVYNLLENTSDLAMGQKFVIVGTKVDGTDPYVAGEIDNNGRLVGDQVIVGAINTENKTLSLTAENAVDYIFDGEQSALKIKNDENKYLQAGNASVSWTTTGGNWTISFADSKTNLASGSYKLQRNGGNYEWFTTYQSDQKPIQIYTLPYEQAYTLTYKNGDETIKTVKIVAGYEYTIVNTQTGTIPEGCTFYAWTDGTNFYQAGDQITVNADITLTAAWTETLRGNLYDGKWGTFCPRQEVHAMQGASFYTLTYLEMKEGMPYKLFFDEIDTDHLEAGKPYLFIAEGEEIKGVKVGGITTEAKNYNGFYGNITAQTQTISTDRNAYEADTYINYYGLTNNTFTLLANGTTVASERAVVQIKDGELNCATPVYPVPARAGLRRVVAGASGTNTATGIDELNASETPVKVLINGEIFILRGEKMYDVTGKLVK